mmetsp:Transcript_3381/g.11085  ORF Transcript_3381/g.11085 Transcript_3381/m.11085 type:complete len:163 (-) Transcript_3381:2510-2998(-)
MFLFFLFIILPSLSLSLPNCRNYCTFGNNRREQGQRPDSYPGVGLETRTPTERDSGDGLETGPLCNFSGPLHSCEARCSECVWGHLAGSDCQTECYAEVHNTLRAGLQRGQAKQAMADCLAICNDDSSFHCRCLGDRRVHDHRKMMREHGYLNPPAARRDDL